MDSYIEFPKLGWKFAIDDTIVSLPFFGTELTIKWYGVLIAVGFLLAVWYAFCNNKRFGVRRDPMMDVVLVCTVFAFLGARLYYVLFSDSRQEYFANPSQIFAIWNGGLAIYGGVIMAFVTALWVCPLRKVNTLRMFDLASLGFLIGQAVGRWGNFFNQEAFGGNTDLPWGMTGSWISSYSNYTDGYDRSLPVHPTFLYESLWCALGFVLLHILSKKAYRFKGQIFSLYVIWYGTGRFFIETLRTDSLHFGTMRVSCLVEALSVLAGVILYFVLKGKEERASESNEETIPLAVVEGDTEGDVENGDLH